MIQTALSIIIAGLCPALIGFLWFHPRVFGGIWMRMTHLPPEQAVGQHGAAFFASIGVVAGVVMAFIMRSEIAADPRLIEALAHALLLWLGFVATVGLGAIIWERKPVSFYLLTAGYWLVAMLAMAVTLFFLR